MSQESITQIYNIFIQKNQLVYEFVSLHNQYASIGHDYGTDEPVTMAEAHTVELIGQNPGITITELSTLQRKTTGAVAQIITKLDKRGYLIRRQHATHGKKVCYYVSEKGVKLNQLHRQFDIQKLGDIFTALLKEFTPEEIDIFFRVIEGYNQAILTQARLD